LTECRKSHTAPWLHKLNTTPGRNKAVAVASAVKNRNTKLLRGGNNGRTYAKFHGRLEHRVVAERLIGRKLNSREFVHHIDGDKRNNDPSNLLIMTPADHTALHGHARRR